jgi:hypothetical protein
MPGNPPVHRIDVAELIEWHSTARPTGGPSTSLADEAETPRSRLGKSGPDMARDPEVAAVPEDPVGSRTRPTGMRPGR